MVFLRSFLSKILFILPADISLAFLFLDFDLDLIIKFSFILAFLAPSFSLEANSELEVV